MKYLKLFESEDNLDHKKVLREVLDIIFDNQLISERQYVSGMDDIFYFLFKYDSDTNSNVLVGALTYYIKENNPFYDGGRFPENRYVIEIEDAEEVYDDDDPETPVIDLYHIRLVPIKDGKFSKEKLEKYLVQIYNNKRY